MNTFDYARDFFRSDLEDLFHGEPIINHLPIRLHDLRQERRVHFIACLFTEVLADQVLHSHFHQHHAAYELSKRPAKMGAGLAAGYPHHVLDHATTCGSLSVVELIGPLVSACVLMCSECDRVFREQSLQITLDGFRQSLLADRHVMRWGLPEASSVLRIAHTAVIAGFDFYQHVREADA